MARCGARSRVLVLAAGLSLATSLAACSGAADVGAPAGATEPAASPAASTEPPAVAPSPAPATPAMSGETPHPPTTTSEAPTQEPLADPAAPEASPPSDEPVSTATGASAATATLGEPSIPTERAPFRYDTYDRSGAVTEPGHYAFLADPDDPASVVTTYEGLRDGSATALLIHTSDAHGVSRVDHYAAVAPGDLFEWRQADDCFVRYQVTAVKPDPMGTAPRKLLAVEWMTYAFTGCSGAIATTTAATLDWAELPDLGGTSLTAPVIHGTFQIVPATWTGATEPGEVHRPPGSGSGPLYPSPGIETENLATARQFPYWRDPALPAGWTLSRAQRGGWDVTAHGYCATYVDADGYLTLSICGDYAVGRRWAENASWLARGENPGERRQGVFETRVIAGRPALVDYSPLGLHHDRSGSVRAWIYDPATESQYYIRGLDPSLLGANVDAVIAIVRSLFERPPPLRYDTYDRTGAVSEPGHYVFLADPADTGTAVTTYEGLRDGTATALLVHTSDAHGVSRVDHYAAVAPGDLFEWRQTADCFVRYQVTAVKPDPTGTAPQKLLGVAWMTYAFTGCAGAIATTTAATLDWAELPDLGGTSLSTPVVHGIYQLVPEGWTGATEARAVRYPPDDSSLTNPVVRTRDLAVARALPHWRDPVLPSGWTLVRATAGVEHLTYGYGAAYAPPGGGGIGLIIEGTYATHRGNPKEAAWRTGNGLGVYETRIIAGRPARVMYSPSGPNNSPTFPYFPVTVWVYDAATESQYTLYGKITSLRGANVDAVIAIAASLLEPPPAP